MIRDEYSAEWLAAIEALDRTPPPRNWRYIVLNGQLFRYERGNVKSRERVPADVYQASRMYTTGYDIMPPAPKGYKFATMAVIPGTKTRQDYYVKVGA